MNAPARDPRLEAFGRLVGTWVLAHRDLNTGECQWSGATLRVLLELSVKVSPTRGPR